MKTINLKGPIALIESMNDQVNILLQKFWHNELCMDDRSYTPVMCQTSNRWKETEGWVKGFGPKVLCKVPFFNRQKKINEKEYRRCG